MWAEGDVFREKTMNEPENGKMAVTRILSGVDDITINGNNKNNTPKEEAELVSSERSCFLRLRLTMVSSHDFHEQY